MGILRLLLALSVVLAHSKFLFKVSLLGSPLAVKAFFIISGFYMSLILNEKYISKGSYKLFISNRFMRIYPVYVAVITVAVLFYIFMYFYPPNNIDYRSYVNPVKTFSDHYTQMDLSTLFFLFLTNVGIFFQDIVMFLALDAQGNLFFTPNFKLVEYPLFTFLFIPQAWSVSLELMFYLIAPFLLRENLKLILSIIVISFVLRFFAYYHGYSNDPWTYRFFPFELAYFLLGKISYLMYKKIQVIKVKPNYSWTFFIFILFLTIIYPLAKFPGNEYVYCFFFIICLPFVFYLSKGWKYDTYLGDLSYPVYLVHILLVGMAKYLIELMDTRLVAIIYMTSVIGFSVLLNELISKRIEKIRRKRYVAFSKGEQQNNVLQTNKI